MSWTAQNGNVILLPSERTSIYDPDRGSQASDGIVHHWPLIADVINDVTLNSVVQAPLNDPTYSHGVIRADADFPGGNAMTLQSGDGDGGAMSTFATPANQNAVFGQTWDITSHDWTAEWIFRIDEMGPFTDPTYNYSRPVGFYGDRLMFFLRANNGTSQPTSIVMSISSFTGLGGTLNTWFDVDFAAGAHHVLMTGRTENPFQFSVYLDGELVDQYSETDGSLTTTAHFCAVIGNCRSGTEWYYGAMNEVALWQGIKLVPSDFVATGGIIPPRSNSLKGGAMGGGALGKDSKCGLVRPTTREVYEINGGR